MHNMSQRYAIWGVFCVALILIFLLLQRLLSVVLLPKPYDPALFDAPLHAKEVVKLRTEHSVTFDVGSGQYIMISR